MRTPTLMELRRALGRALLAAPLAMAACRHEPKQPTEREHPVAIDAGTKVLASTIDAMGNTPPPQQPDAAPTPKGICKHAEPDVTGCGGAEVKLLEPATNCGLGGDDELDKAACDAYCGNFDTRSCHSYTDRDQHIAVFCDAANPCMGRAPSDGACVAATTDVDEHLAAARAVEAHSVAAFRELGRDLARWGAPTRLQRACARAARDEARHAAAMTRLLRRRGAALPEVARAAAPGFASLRALALHNEREGVIGETWGALIAQHQAAHAADPEVRAAMATIADEETTHAQLAFEIAAWARSVLGDAELDAARAAALRELRSTLGYRPGDGAAAELGWPSRAASVAMLDALAPALAV